MTLWGFDLWSTSLAFARIGALVMLMPGLGEAMVPPRVRLGFALLLAIMLAPPVAAPADIWGASGQIVIEIAVGLMLGGVARILMTSLATAGQIFGLETGLSFAQTADPTEGGQAGQILGVFLGLMGVTLVFATNLHHVFLLGIRDSYNLFAAGKPFSVGDASELGLGAFIDAFRIGLQIAAPVVVAGLVFRLGLGVLARLAPSIQVFFVAMPLNILGGFAILTLGLSAGLLVWLDRLQTYAHAGGG